MRRVAGVILIGLGVFGIAMAILLPTVVVDRSKKTPLDLNITQISSGSAKLLDPSTNSVRQVQLRATRVVKTDSHASNGTDTTVNETLCIVIVSGPTPNCLHSNDPRLLSITTDRVTTDRRSAEAVHVPGWNENVNGDSSVRHQGLAYKWPIDAQKRTYLFYLTDLKRAFPATYAGTSTVAGLTVYEYVCKTGTQPYKVQGLFDGTYNDTRTVWVEPQTGAIINGVEHQVQTLANGTVALDTTLHFDQSAIDFQSHYAKSKIDKLRQAELWGPLIAGLVGVLALVGGILLLRTRRPHGGEPGDERPGDTTPPDDQPAQSDEPPAFAGSSSQT